MKPSLPLFLIAVGAFAYGESGSQKQITEPGRKAPAVNFGRDVMPILSSHCFKCHGPDAAKAAAGLRLDSFGGATKLLDDGSAIVPGNPSKSLLLERVSETNQQMRMPPPGSGVPSLSAPQIETLRAWIVAGAGYKKHWSFVAPIMPTTPVVSNPRWRRNLIDTFVLAKLDSSGLKPEPEADRNTLAMRAAETLTGLPPTPEQLKQYLADRGPSAYERFVDRLIATPAYGEHEARYWLDAVRYADTHGLQLDNERSVFPYRDWVVRAFNKDLPYDKFVKWQVAGDLLPNPTTEQLVATGYVRMNLTSNEGGAIEDEFLARNTFDRVDTTSTVLMGLTIGCARCHDHKYDPIKQRDYYGLYAIFDSTQDKPLDGNIALPPPVLRASTRSQDARLSSMAADLSLLKRRVDPAKAFAWFTSNHQPTPATRDWRISPVYSSASFDEAFDKPEPAEPGQTGDVSWKPFKFLVGQDNANLIGKDNSSVYLEGTVSLPAARQMTLGVSSDDGIRLWLNGKLIHSHKVNRGLAEGIDKVAADFRKGDNRLVAKLVNGGSIDGLNIRIGDGLDARLDKVLAWFPVERNDPALRDELCTDYLAVGPVSSASLSYRKLVKERAEFEAAIPMTLIAREMATPRPTFILKRGQYDQPGDAVERHIPPAIGKWPPGAPHNRLGLAEWLTSPSNPLTARVFVNRVWQQHFGTGVVKTVEDLGTQGEWPLNQPLLDALAVTFVKSGWSVKKLNRLIVTSAAFRQSSRISPAKLAEDPENRLISRGPRFRLDAEVIRDKSLAAAGLLQASAGGRGFKPYQPSGLWEAASDPASETHVYMRDHGSMIYKRSMYLFWKRTSPPPVMIAFDAPLRDACTVRRSITNTPLQALSTLNETGFLEASRVMAERVLRSRGHDKSRIESAYGFALGRNPDSFELGVMSRALARYRRYYAAHPDAARSLIKVGDWPQWVNGPTREQAAWMLICSSLMNTNEFLSLH